MEIKALIGSGDKIGMFTLPVLITGLASNHLFPSLFSVGGPPMWLRMVSYCVLVPGIINWVWSAALILTHVPMRKLITSGPYSLVKHPLYVGVALLVLPWIGFIQDTWLGALIGSVVLLGSRIFATEEEKALSRTFGPRWDEYERKVKISWL